MSNPGPTMMILLMLAGLGVYFGVLAMTLRLAARWILDRWIGWGRAFKVLLILTLIQIGANLLLGLVLTLGGAGPAMMADAPLVNILMFIINLLITSYVYGHWLSADEYDEPIGLWRGFLVYLTQIAVIILLAMVIALVVGVFMSQFK